MENPLKIFVPALVTTGIIFTAKNCCSIKKYDETAMPSDEEEPIVEKIAPIQDAAREEMFKIFVIPGECPEGVMKQLTCNTNMPAAVPSDDKRPLDGQYFGDGPGINAYL